MIFIGIDPGKDGAIATVGGVLDPTVIKPPLIKAKGSKALYDVTDLAAFFNSLRLGSIFVTVEWIQGMPATMGGTLANFERGYAQGLYQALLHAFKIPFQMVRPATWQKVMHAGTPGGDTKQKSILAAKRLFPMTSLVPPGSRNNHDGFADALLLAEYGRRTHKGGAREDDTDEPAD